MADITKVIRNEKETILRWLQKENNKPAIEVTGFTWKGYALEKQYDSYSVLVDGTHMFENWDEALGFIEEMYLIKVGSN